MRSVTESQIEKYMEIASDKTIPDQASERMPARLNNAELVDLLHETVMIRDMKGKIQYWNRGADEMYGWKSEEALDSISHELLRTKFPKPLSDIESDLADQGRWQGELVHTRRDGSTIVVKSRWVLKQDSRSNEGEVVEINQICGKPE
jgi:PAS domain S-box-containing protein